MSSYEDYAGLGETGFGGAREPVKPEDEFFHSVYIAGQTRINHINKEELAGKLQIRGVEYNKDSVCFIITHIKEVLVKDWKYVILKCEDCGEGYRAGIDVEYRWVIEKLPKKEIKEDTELIDVPGQLFFSFYES